MMASPIQEVRYESIEEKGFPDLNDENWGEDFDLPFDDHPILAICYDNDGEVVSIKDIY